uniref:MgtE domain-containing protein n=1 Tax=Heterorhabditis bacteriophora TaxID=37862 RepID=A0A1I7XJ36_HETBA
MMSRPDEVVDINANQAIYAVQVHCPSTEAHTLSTSASEQWIFAPIAVTIQKMTMKKPPYLHEKLETRTAFFLETIVPFLFAGLGLIFAGLLLENAERWSFFTELPDAVTLVPTLVGLKGNLEMTLASRLSTLANLGFMETGKQKWQVALSNMALIQTQAIVVSSIAVVPAIILGEKLFNLPDFLCIMLSAVTTASIASLLLGAIMIGVVIMARKFNINPDNITTPVAASLGDVTTLFILLGLGTIFLHMRLRMSWVLIVFLCVMYVLAIFGAYLASRDQFTLEVSQFFEDAVVIIS